MKQNNTKRDIIKKLSTYFSKQKNVEFAYLFGSKASGKSGKLSDVDIAVFLNENLNKEERVNIQLKLLSEIIDLLKTDEIDLVVMNDISLLLRYNIIRYGKILKDNEKRIKTEAKILSEYLDMKYYIDRHTKYALKRFAEKGII